MRVLADLFGQQATLVVSDVAGGRTDEPADGVALHVFGHVEPDEVDAQGIRQLAGQLGLSDAGRAGEDEAADRFVGCRQSSTAEFDRLDDGFDCIVLAVDVLLDVVFQVRQSLLFAPLDVDVGNPGDLGDDLLDVGHRNVVVLVALRMDTPA